MKKRKRIGWKRPEHPLQEIIISPFLALVFSVPATIISIIVFVILGFSAMFLDSLEDVLNTFFNMLPFWNDKWDYYWSLYFGLIAGIIFEIYFTFKIIYESFSEYEHIPAKAAPKYDGYEPSWESMSTDEKKDWLRNYYPDTYNEIYYGIPKPQNNAEILAELKKQNEQRERDAFMRHLENKRKADELIDELKKHR